MQECDLGGSVSWAGPPGNVSGVTFSSLRLRRYIHVFDLCLGGDASSRARGHLSEGGRKTAFQNKTRGRMLENLHVWSPERTHTDMGEGGGVQTSAAPD